MSGDLAAASLLAYAPTAVNAHDDVDLAAVVRSLVGYFGEQRLLASPPPTPTQSVVGAYAEYLERLRGLAATTVNAHRRTASELLRFLRYDRVPARLRDLGPGGIEVFLKRMGRRQGRHTLQHTVAQLRSFLRFLADEGLAPSGLASQIDTPRVYRGERLPRALSWETTRALLRAIDRSTPMGRRDYAMLLLVATYGLRSCEVVALKLEDVDWRARRLCVPRPKIGTPLVLPLTAEVGGALLDYLQHGRPDLPDPEIFLRVRAPDGRLKPTALTEAFQCWVRRSGLPILYQGPHCLRHSLAVHLLRKGTPLKVIGDLLGHRSTESTCVYLRLHLDDLRDVALDLPVEVDKEERP